MAATALANVLRLEIPPRPGYVSMVRLVVSTAATLRRSLVPERVEDLTLALSEACTNAIEAHGAGEPTTDVVTIDVSEDEERLVVTVTDRGNGFDPMQLSEHPPPTDPNRLHYDRGLGIPIIKQLVDEVTFRSGDDGTTVELVVRCPPAPEAALEVIDLDDLGDIDAAWDDE